LLASIAKAYLFGHSLWICCNRCAGQSMSGERKTISRWPVTNCLFLFCEGNSTGNRGTSAIWHCAYSSSQAYFRQQQACAGGCMLCICNPWRGDLIVFFFHPFWPLFSHDNWELAIGIWVNAWCMCSARRLHISLSEKDTLSNRFFGRESCMWPNSIDLQKTLISLHCTGPNLIVDAHHS